MEFVKVMNINRRMCKYYHGNRSCDDCPLSIANNNSGLQCNKFTQEYPLIAEDLIIKWGKEHPQKTRFMDIKEKCPSIVIWRDVDTDDKYPVACAQHLGYVAKCPYEGLPESKCRDCWNQPIDD